MVRIQCFQNDPSVVSSLKFLRRTPWAREKVESLYLWHLREQKRRAAKGGPTGGQSGGSDGGSNGGPTGGPSGGYGDDRPW